ncbi:aldolase/citrate lyase family protein [Chelativorans sp. Marseille-P2723]|uniref:HpcH/HpaI aldolase family protein n=1 Tax=Chelativorans sp. Marseille-P2723 TaxID=2709133 RepID=UPI00156F8AEA|nr:aldolase/citrate lyase family protein [Chelativorans sp. Marseille-P2723]
MTMVRRIKDKLASGQPVLVVNPGGAAFPVIDPIASAGADCLFIDCERTPVSVESVHIMARMAHAAGLCAVVRVPTPDPALLIRYIDCRVDGIVLPQVESAAECRQLVEVARDASNGREGDLLLIPQIETIEGHARLEEIATSPGIDLVLIGPNDLALSMGHPGNPRHPDVLDAVEDIMVRLRRAGCAFGLPVDEDSAALYVEKGAGFLYLNLHALLKSSLSRLSGIIRDFNGENE